MKVSTWMDIERLREMMGAEASRDEAKTLRGILLRAGWADTDAIQENVWLSLIEDAVRHTDRETVSHD
jgi:hypothetical protein